MEQISPAHQKACFFHRDIARHLLHPFLIWMTRYSCQTDSPALQVKEEQNVERFQALEREYLYGEEICSDHHCHVCSDKIFPACVLFPLRGWRNVMSLQDVADCLIGDLVTEIGHRSHNPVITPTRILPGHTYHQIFDFCIDGRTPHGL